MRGQQLDLWGLFEAVAEKARNGPQPEPCSTELVPSPEEESCDYSAIKLREYQVEAVRRFDIAVADGHKWIALTMPTGAGKTIVSAAITYREVFRGAKVVFQSHRKQINWQTVDKYELLGLNPALDMGAIHSGGAKVTITTPQTVRSRGRVLDADVIFLDEAHRKEHVQAFPFFRPGALVIGLTATPIGMEPPWSALVIGARNSQLIKIGALVPPRIFAPAAPDISDARKSSDGDISIASAEEMIGRGRIIDGVKYWHDITPHARTVVFGASIKHARMIAEAFKEMGVTSEALDSDLPTKKQRAVLERFSQGETTVLANCSMLCEGYDLPAMECVMSMRPTLSEYLWIQMCGRGARPFPGKTHYTLIDCSGAVYLHGSPNQDHKWSLAEPGRKSSRTSKSSISQCPACFFVFLAGETVCPNCGSSKSAKAQKYSNGQLIEVTDDIAKKQLSESTVRTRHLYFLGTKIRRLRGDALKQYVGRHLHNYEKVKGAVDWREYVSKYARRDALV